MASKKRTIRKKRKTKRKTKRKILKYNNKIQSNKKRKTKRHYKIKKCNKQNGGINVGHSLLNAARYVPHTITNAYNGLVGNTSSTSFLPWEGHYT